MKTQIKINPITHNFLDNRFQNMLLPFRCLHHMMFLSRFSIKYNCVRPHRVTYYTVSLVGTLGFIIFHIQNLLAREFDGVTNSFLIVFIKLNVVLVALPFVISYILNIILRIDHVLMILKIHKAFRLVNFNHYKRATRRGWLGIVRHLISYVIAVLLTRNLKLAVYFYSSIYTDLNLSYGVFIIAIITDGIKSWIVEVNYYCILCLKLKDDKYNDKFIKLFQAYVTLMEAFDSFKKIFKFAALLQALETFFLSILYLQTIIELSKSGNTHYGTYDVETFFSVTVFWVLKNICFVSMFCSSCEKFYVTITEVDSVCYRLLGTLQNTMEAKILCKNVQRLNRATFHKMTACRLFTIDARLPHAFNNLVLEYLCVTFQFAIISYIKYNYGPKPSKHNV